MDKRFLLNRLQQEKNALEHPQALDRFLRETEHLHGKSARRRFPGSKAGWAALIASLGTLGIIAFAVFSLLR